KISDYIKEFNNMARKVDVENASQGNVPDSRRQSPNCPRTTASGCANSSLTCAMNHRPMTASCWLNRPCSSFVFFFLD
ncbi:hypothetical protein PENTCL1PPCAC_27682, partial [Pristionchus entomophagus]